MPKLGHRSTSRRLFWIVGIVAAVSIVASFGTPKAGCSWSEGDDQAADDDPPGDSPEDLDRVSHVPTAKDGYAPPKLDAVRGSVFCPTAGKVTKVGDRTLNVNTAGMRGVIAGDASSAGELAFVFHGDSAGKVPLANGELRQQIGLKLRAKDTCNVVYVMWHVAPKPGIWVSVKSNPGKATHAECGDEGYLTPKSITGATPPLIVPNEPHTLRADLDGEFLRVHADGVAVWEGPIPKEAFAFDGAVGVRSDNGNFDFELRVPGGKSSVATCTNPGTELAH